MRPKSVIARILSPGEFLFEGWSGLREPVHWSVWCLTCQRLLRKAGARLRWWSLQCSVGVQLGCFFLKDVATYARWTREPLWNRLAIWTSLPETSAGCQCTAKFLCRKSMDISITGTKRLPGVGRMCFKCSVLVKWVAKAASKNHRKENQRIQALTSSARKFLPYTESCKWCKTHSNSASLPDFWPFQPVPTCVRNNPVQGDGGGKTFLTCHVNTNCLQTNVQQSHKWCSMEIQNHEHSRAPWFMQCSIDMGKTLGPNLMETLEWWGTVMSESSDVPYLHWPILFSALDVLWQHSNLVTGS